MSPVGVISLADYQRIWAESMVQVLQQISGRAFKPELYPILPGSAVGTGDPVWINFSVSKALTGHHAFRLRPGPARGLAELLLGDPFEEAPSLQPEVLDAVGEIFRQFAGAAAVALKSRIGGEVTIEFAGHDAPSWDVGMRQGVALIESPSSRFDIQFISDKVLIESLLHAGPASAGSAKAAAPASKEGAAAAPARAPEKTKAAASAASTAVLSGNVDLLLDVELDVTLRFGGRSMLLRDVLELNPGAVLELDRHIQDPVELLVADKVIALGEVVIVDGNYGLKITQLVSPSQRVAAFSKTS